MEKAGRWGAVEALLSEMEQKLATHADAIVDITAAVASIPVGRDGKDGINGKDGADGRDGVDGKDGINGKDGADGRDGVDGKDGINGKDGADGRDALELDILDTIDPQKSYPRGTVAAYRGGLIKATRRTGPIGDSLSAAGWRVILRGVAQTEVVPSDDLRTLGIRLTHTDGEVVEQTLRSPSLLYRGVFREGDQYDGGDAVTFGGSLWVALRATTTKPGDGSPDWRLAVKKGRDGRDAK
ncbi:MAG: hypothetical protein GX886_03315, partial [Comamonadaceae bacterium]|nr:hypothetical protein [Comamonadaceae bacterium]